MLRQSNHFFFLILLCIFVFAVVGGTVSAETSSICHIPAAFPTIQAAIDNNTCTEIIVAAGTFGDAVIVDRNVTIRGEARNSTFIRNQVLIIEDAALTLESLTVTFSPSHGIELSSNEAELNATDIAVTFSSGWGIQTTEWIGAVETQTNITDCDISENQGGIRGAFLDIDDCFIGPNYGLGGVKTYKSAEIRNSTIAGNRKDAAFAVDQPDGAGVLIDVFSELTTTIENTTIRGNEVYGPSLTSNGSDGGGIMVRRGHAIVRHSTITQNVAGRRGGGIAVHNIFNSSLVLEDSTVSNNTAYDVGGGISAGNTTTIDRSIIEENHARSDPTYNLNGSAWGGGIYAFGGRLLVRNTTINLNEAIRAGSITGNGVGMGGGIAALDLGGSPVVFVGSSTISRNYAYGQGGGVYLTIAGDIVNSTIAENRSNRDGGGVSAESTPRTTLSFVTIVDNITDDNMKDEGDGGGVAGNASIYHSIIAYNKDLSPGSTTAPDCFGDVQSTGYNILRISDDCPNFVQTINDVLVGTTGFPANVSLARPLADHGGLTQTIALVPESIAVDKGVDDCHRDNLYDQRGASRNNKDGNGNPTDGNPCDVGAFEIDPIYVPTAVELRDFYADARGVQLWQLIAGLAVLVWLTIGKFRPKSPHRIGR